MNASEQVRDVAHCASCGAVSLDVWLEQIEQAHRLGRVVA